jgi:hypothetical protein
MPDDPQLEFVRSERFTTVYTNSANLEVTPWDFRLTFGELQRVPNKSPRVEQFVAVVMSPQHAKALLAILRNHVEEYEKQVGEIKLPQPTASEEKPATIKSQ